MVYTEVSNGMPAWPILTAKDKILYEKLYGGSSNDNSITETSNTVSSIRFSEDIKCDFKANSGCLVKCKA